MKPCYGYSRMYSLKSFAYCSYIKRMIRYIYNSKVIAEYYKACRRFVVNISFHDDKSQISLFFLAIMIHCKYRISYNFISNVSSVNT